MVESMAQPVSRRRGRRAVYSPLLDALREAIDSGELAPGSLIPSENALAEQHGISRSSVRLALRELAASGHIRKLAGKGSVVSDTLDGRCAPSVIPVIGADFEIPPAGHDYWYGAKIMPGVQDACAHLGCRLAMFPRQQFEAISPDFYNGLILTRVRADDYPQILALSKRGVRAVLINRIVEDPAIAYVSVSYRRESEKAATWLLEQGCRRIGIVTTPFEHDEVNEPRYMGFHDAEHAQGLSGAGMLFFAPARVPDRSYCDLLYSYLLHAELDGIYLLNGAFASPLFAAMERIGMTPETAPPVMCFDDIGAMQPYHRYGFGYVKMPLAEMGADAVEYLVGGSGGTGADVLKKVYPAELVFCNR